MDRWLTKKLEMAARVQEFHRANPYADRNQSAIVAQFEEALAEAQALQLQEDTERRAADTLQRQRRDVRGGLEGSLLRALARVGTFALREDPAAARRFGAPASNGSNAAFLAHATSLLELARSHQEALTQYGFARAQVNELAASIARYREVATAAETGRQKLGETRTKLRRTTAELSELLRLLDVFNRGRFAADAGLLAMWRSLSTIGRVPVLRRRRNSEDAASDAPTPAPSAAHAAEVAPATDGAAAV